MKTLLKNQCTYRNRIGTPGDEHDTMKKEDEDEEGNHDGNRDNKHSEGGNSGDKNESDSWEAMYQAVKQRGLGNDEDDDKIEDKDKSENGADNEDEDGGDNRKETNGNSGVSRRKDDKGRNEGYKMTNQPPEQRG